MNRSDLERQAWRDKMRGFAKKVRAMNDAERAALAERMPIVTCEGHALSVHNQCMLAFQSDRTLTVVGGYRQWQKVGRMVRKSEHAAGYILVPLARKEKAGERVMDNATGAGQNGERDALHFRFVPVFDVTQTEEGYSPADSLVSLRESEAQAPRQGAVA